MYAPGIKLVHNLRLWYFAESELLEEFRGERKHKSLRRPERLNAPEQGVYQRPTDSETAIFRKHRDRLQLYRGAFRHANLWKYRVRRAPDEVAIIRFRDDKPVYVGHYVPHGLGYKLIGIAAYHGEYPGGVAKPCGAKRKFRCVVHVSLNGTTTYALSPFVRRIIPNPGR